MKKDNVFKLVTALEEEELIGTWVCACENPLFLIELPDRLLCSECLEYQKDIKWIKRNDED